MDADDIEVVQAIKQETEETGGGPGSTDIPFPEPINPLEDGLESAALFLVESGRRNKTVAIWPYQGNLRFRDVSNPGIGYTLTQILAGEGSVTPDAHKALLQLIHFIDEGPAEGFTSGAIKTTTGTVFPTQELWKRQDGTKLIEKNITWTGVVPTTEEWKIYDTDGITVLATVTDSFTYSGIFETNRTRAIS